MELPQSLHYNRGEKRSPGKISTGSWSNSVKMSVKGWEIEEKRVEMQERQMNFMMGAYSMPPFGYFSSGGGGGSVAGSSAMGMGGVQGMAYSGRHIPPPGLSGVCQRGHSGVMASPPTTLPTTTNTSPSPT